MATQRKKRTAKKKTARKTTSQAKGRTRKSASSRKQVKGSAKMTTDHEEIRQWVEAKGGCPATVKATHKKGDAGILRIDFPGYSGKTTLESISWDEFFDKFDKEHLAFLYQDKTKSGRPSRFFKIVRPENSRSASKR